MEVVAASVDWTSLFLRTPPTRIRNLHRLDTVALLLNDIVAKVNYLLGDRKCGC